jgi:hypothetical protein
VFPSTAVLLPTPWLFNTNVPNCISLLPIFKRNHNNHKFQIVGPYILTFVSKSWPDLRQHFAENSLIYKSKCFVYRYFGEDSYLSKLRTNTKSESIDDNPFEFLAAFGDFHFIMN